MLPDVLKPLGELFPLKEVDVGNFVHFKVSPMDIRAQRFEAPGLGSLSYMEAKAMLGLMQMTTVVINPKERDIPLLSYDFISVMGKLTMLVEYYDTTAPGTSLDMSAQEAIKATLHAVANHDLGQHWYDSMKLPCSIAKKDGKKQRQLMDKAFADSLTAYGLLAKAAPLLEGEQQSAKRERTLAYVNGLFDNGGPSTDAFVKALGKEQAYRFYTGTVFATD